MIAASMSAPRSSVIRLSTKGDHIHPDNVDPPVFLGRNMTIYAEGEEEKDLGSDDSDDVMIPWVLLFSVPFEF